MNQDYNQTILKEIKSTYVQLMNIYNSTHYLEQKQISLLKMKSIENNQNNPPQCRFEPIIMIETDKTSIELKIFEKDVYNSPETCDQEVYIHNISDDVFQKRSFNFKKSKVYIRFLSLYTFFFNEREKEELIEDLLKINQQLSCINTILMWNKLYKTEYEYDKKMYFDLNEKMKIHNIGHELTFSYQMICNMDNSEKVKMFKKVVEYHPELLQNIEISEIDCLLKKLRTIYNEAHEFKPFRDDYIRGIKKSKDIFLEVIKPITLQKTLEKTLNIKTEGNITKTKL